MKWHLLALPVKADFGHHVNNGRRLQQQITKYRIWKTESKNWIWKVRYAVRDLHVDCMSWAVSTDQHVWVPAGEADSQALDADGCERNSGGQHDDADDWLGADWWWFDGLLKRQWWQCWCWSLLVGVHVEASRDGPAKSAQAWCVQVGCHDHLKSILLFDQVLIT